MSSFSLVHIIEASTPLGAGWPGPVDYLVDWRAAAGAAVLDAGGEPLAPR
jgi:hypothetical protein